MFISKLIHTIENYDPYGLNRFNGIKMLYILLVLFGFNSIFNVPHPYFYFFYVPLSLMSVELTAETVKEKYQLFIFTNLLTSVFILYISILRPYPLFFLLFAFVTSSSFFAMVLRKQYMTIPAVSIILSLLAYSLNYPEYTANVAEILDNLCTAIVVTGVIIGALILFPRSYYYRMWLRALHLLVQDILNHLVSVKNREIINKKSTNVPAIRLMQFSKMLPYKLPIFTILKIDLLVGQLYSYTSVMQEPLYSFSMAEVEQLIQETEILLLSIEQEKPCEINHVQNALLLSLMRSWNQLCLHN